MLDDIPGEVFQAAVDAFHSKAVYSPTDARITNLMTCLGAFAEVLFAVNDSKWTEENVNSHVVIGDERWVEGWKRGYMRAALDAERYPEMLLNHAKKHHQHVTEIRDQLLAEQEARLRIQNDEALINVGR